jgi:ATP-dependent exoDNAse (exonuclease V) beta subunit
LVEIAQRSELWQSARRSKQRFVEVPFAVLVPRSELGLKDGPQETVLRGTIDLVFSLEGVWVIVDYKSDTIDFHNLPDLVARYKPQLLQYRQYWERLTGESTRGALFFLETGHVEWVL